MSVIGLQQSLTLVPVPGNRLDNRLTRIGEGENFALSATLEVVRVMIVLNTIAALAAAVRLSASAPNKGIYPKNVRKIPTRIIKRQKATDALYAMLS